MWETSWALTEKSMVCGIRVCIRHWLLQAPDYKETISMESSLVLTGSGSKLAPKSAPPPPLRELVFKKEMGLYNVQPGSP